MCLRSCQSLAVLDVDKFSIEPREASIQSSSHDLLGEQTQPLFASALNFSGFILAVDLRGIVAR